jgi:hypothetical protein
MSAFSRIRAALVLQKKIGTDGVHGYAQGLAWYLE